MRTSLYRYFDADGVLLYIGISMHPFGRWKQHKASEKETDRVATIKIEWFSNRTLAEVAERDAIRAEGPAWNVMYAKPDPETYVPPPPMQGPHEPWRRFSVGRSIHAPDNLAFSKEIKAKLFRALRKNDRLFVPRDQPLCAFFENLADRRGVIVIQADHDYVEPR